MMTVVTTRRSSPIPLRRLLEVRPLRRLLWLIVVSPMVAATAARADEPVRFETDVVPILEQHCIRCHYPGNEKGDVSLATAEDLRANEYIVAGDPDASYLIDLVTGVDGAKPAMPAEGDPLSEAQVATLRRWVTDGADWPEDVIVRAPSKADRSWWSLQPLADVVPPDVDQLPADWGAHPIDRFIVAKLQEAGLQPSPPADRRALIRRATYDLTGLPPTPAEVAAFENDSSAEAWPRLIDRLLDSPHYGERWGRHWLDVVRFGESNGFERNVIIDSLWPFRDYVIRSLNEDKPFDQFLREHLAGDVFGAGDPDVAVASAFLVAGPYDDVGNQDAVAAAQIRADTLDEIISATGQAFLGMTIGCARCHDHKFDPITQRDYYSLYATFAGVRHGAVPLAPAGFEEQRQAKLQPLQARKSEIEKRQHEIQASLLERGRTKLSEYIEGWTRPPVNRVGTEDRFEPVTAKFVRLICEAQDSNPQSSSGFGIDEFEVWSPEPQPRNVALASAGATATGASRPIEDFPGAYGPHLAIDGKAGARFIAAGNNLTIELAAPTLIDRVVFSSARNETTPEQGKFTFVAEYRIAVSTDGSTWTQVASGADRKPVGWPDEDPTGEPPASKFLDHRLLALETTAEEAAEQKMLAADLAEVNQQIAAVPTAPHVWIGHRNPDDAKGPFHVFLGGSPQKPAEQVTPAGLSALADLTTYELPADADEATRRLKLAEWITDPQNPLTPRVLANRLWHHHFGTGIVDTPNDLGYMGGRPTHPELLDDLARRLQDSGWSLKAMHRFLMTSQTYQQASTHRDEAARVDANSRLLWRFPPRRLSAEEIRDTMLQIAGVLDERMGGPGFRLYHFMQDNVCTYVPLDHHGPETYRRAVYHQNARASVTDLMTDFDQPDCAFSTPDRAETTTPLQALTMLNHQFTIDMASALAARLEQEADGDIAAQIGRAYQLCYARQPTPAELMRCTEFVEQYHLPALCRVLLNTSELIYVR